MEKKGKKRLLTVLAVAILATMVMTVAAEAQEWGRCPTLDAWRMAGQRNGYDAGYADGYAGYPAYPRYNSPEYREGYHSGNQEGHHRRYAHGGHSNYGSYGSHPFFYFTYRNRSKGWSISIPAPPVIIPGWRY